MVQMLPPYHELLCTRLLSADEVNKKVPAMKIYAHKTKTKTKPKSWEKTSQSEGERQIPNTWITYSRACFVQGHRMRFLIWVTFGVSVLELGFFCKQFLLESYGTSTVTALEAIILIAQLICATHKLILGLGFPCCQLCFFPIRFSSLFSATLLIFLFSSLLWKHVCFLLSLKEEEMWDPAEPSMGLYRGKQWLQQPLAGSVFMQVTSSQALLAEEHHQVFLEEWICGYPAPRCQHFLLSRILYDTPTQTYLIAFIIKMTSP